MKEHKVPPEEALLRLCLYCSEPMELERYYWDLGYRHYHFLCVNCNQKVVVTQLTYTRIQSSYGLSRLIERNRRKKMDSFLDLPDHIKNHHLNTNLFLLKKKMRYVIMIISNG